MYALVFQVDFSFGLSTKHLYIFLPSSMRATCPAHLILLGFISELYLGTSKNYEAHTVQLPPFSFYFIPLGPNFLLRTLF
jgi:hypothetical protein